jgi:hypothetical protein
MYKVEFQVEIDERALKVIEYKLKRLEDDFFKSAEAMAMIQSKTDYYDEDQYQRIADGVDELETKFSVSNLSECPEDAIIGRDLFDADDYLRAVKYGIALAKQGYDDVEYELEEE